MLGLLRARAIGSVQRGQRCQQQGGEREGMDVVHAYFPAATGVSAMYLMVRLDACGNTPVVIFQNCLPAWSAVTPKLMAVART